MFLTRSDSFRVLTCSSLCRRQFVSAPRLVGFFVCSDLSLPSRCCLQFVRGPHLVGFFLYPDMSLPMPSPVGERPSLGRILSLSFLVLICTSQCRLQFVSAPCSVRFFPCPDVSLPMLSLGCECPRSVGFIPRLTLVFRCRHQEVSAPRSPGFFRVLICPFR